MSTPAPGSGHDLPVDPSTTPAQVRIQIRPEQFDFGQVPRFWLRDAATTHFFNALSVLIPQTERVVMEILREQRNLSAGDTCSPALRQAVDGLIRQEALHAAAHRRSNRQLASHGYPAIARFESIQKRLLGILRRILPALSLPVAFEFFTAALSRDFLQDPIAYTGGKENVAVRFARWHALEELEHQAVCMDIWRCEGRSRWWLPSLLTFLWIPLTVLSVYGVQTYLLWADRKRLAARDLRGWLRCLRHTLPLFWRGTWALRDPSRATWTSTDLALYRRQLDVFEAQQSASAR